MNQDRAIPEGYMTVGEIAKRWVSPCAPCSTTIRRAFDPVRGERGGRRLYSDKDMVMLHQILSLKSLGFSLSDIKSA